MRRSVQLMGWWMVASGLLVGSAVSWPAYAPSQEKLAAPRVLQVRTQVMGDKIYFHVQLDQVPGWPPDSWVNLSRTAFEVGTSRPMVPVSLIAGAPRLVPQDESASTGYLLWNPTQLRRVVGEVALAASAFPNDTAPGERSKDAIALDQLAPDGLHFVGYLKKRAPVKFLLTYTALEPQELLHPFREKERLKVPWPVCRQIPLTIDFTQAAIVPAAKNSSRNHGVRSDDLEGLFATGLAQFFTIQAWLTKDQGTGFYDFAREMTNRRYGVHVAALPTGPDSQGDYLARQFELTTGAAAIAETLQIRRLTGEAKPISKGPRTEDPSQIRGIDLPEVNWAALLKDNNPEIEPLAHLVPHDQYYLHFTHFGRFLEAGDLLQQWGGPILQAVRLAGQDYRLRERYEQQLCLKSTALAKTFGPAIVESVAITGSDLFLREGSDVTVLFRVKNLPVFLAAVNSQIAQARKTWGNQLKESKSEHLGVTIESFVTPLREVSVHRCTLNDNVVVYSNSLAAIRRIIATSQRGIPALASSKDFRYLRTVFRYKDQNEDAFLFFSDEFLRSLLGPFTRIKESRRSEALTSLYMLHHAALYAAWETGKLPANHKELLERSGLKESDLYQPEGKELRWDGERQLAVSDAYNTIHFATPLIELPLDKVTTQERDAYERFRFRYLALWSGAFDPVAFRLRIRPQEVTAETYILPLINLADYRNLQREIGGKPVRFDLNLIPPQGILYWLVHFPETSSIRRFLRESVLPSLGPQGLAFFRAVGDKALIGLHDDPVLAEMAEKTLLAYMLGTLPKEPDVEWLRNVFSLPVVAGLEVRNPLIFASVLTALKTLVQNAAPQMLSWEPLEKEQHGHKIVAIRPLPDSEIDRLFNPPNMPKKDGFVPGIYYTTVGNMFYVSLREDVLRQMVDRYIAQKKAEGKKPEPAKDRSVEAHMVLQLSPEAAQRLWPVAQWYVETQIAGSALANTALLYPLWHARIVPVEARDRQVYDVAYRLYGFAPISPDGSTVVFDEKRDTVANERHGSLAEPWFPRQPKLDSPLGQLLQSVRHVRVSLEFRQEGAFTVLTLERRPSKQD